MSDNDFMQRAKSLARSQRILAFAGTITIIGLIALTIVFYVQTHDLEQSRDVSRADRKDLRSDVVKQQSALNEANKKLEAVGLAPVSPPKVSTPAVIPPLQGPRGPLGPTGPRGPRGPASNVPGEPGANGEDGSAGANGAPGKNSTVPGPAGKDGKNGADSNVPGPAGKDGKDGKDSSVPGPRGETGPQGPGGPAGPTCPDGYTGQTLNVMTRDQPRGQAIFACVPN